MTLPAGAEDRYVHRVVQRRRRAPSRDWLPELIADAAVDADWSIAIDLDGAPELPDDCDRARRRALAGWRLRSPRSVQPGSPNGRLDDIEQLVPAYVALPRGIARAAAEMTWSPDLR